MLRKFAFLLFPVLLFSSVHFTLENYSLFYNFEYKSNPYYDGRTFFGDWVQGYFNLEINKKVKAQAGAILWRFYGGDRELLPYIAVIYSPSPHFSFRFGNLEKFHSLHRALYFDTFYYERPSERGFQLSYHGNIFQSEAWINWEREMKKLVQENFEVGFKGNFRWKALFSSLQYHYVHYGGEYLEHHNGPRDDMVFMGSLGLKAGVWVLGTLKLSFSYFYSYLIPDRWLEEHSSGRGNEFLVSLSGKYGEVFASNWNGDGFYHQDGDPLYQGKNLIWLGYRKEVILKNFRLNLVLTSGWVDGVWVPYQKIEVSWKKDF